VDVGSEAAHQRDKAWYGPAGLNAALPNEDDTLRWNDSTYIAAASPDVVLRLLDVVEKAKVALECFDRYVCLNEIGQSNMEDEADEARDALRTALSSLESADKSVQLGKGGRE